MHNLCWASSINEMANTRKTLERIPVDKLEYKPDPKSMSLGQLAGHIVEMVGWGTMTLTTESLDMNPGEHKPFIPTSQDQLLSEFDKNLHTLRATLAGMTDADMMKTWTLRIGGNVLFSMPRVGGDAHHDHEPHHSPSCAAHRVLPLERSPVPALYGPSADETGMAASA